MQLDVTETAVANIARKGGTAIVDLLELDPKIKKLKLDAKRAAVKEATVDMDDVIAELNVLAEAGAEDDGDDGVQAILDEAVAARIDAKRDRDVVHFLRAQDLLGLNLPGIQDLTSERKNGLELAISRLLCRAPSRVPLHQKKLASCWIFNGTIGELPG